MLDLLISAKYVNIILVIRDREAAVIVYTKRRGRVIPG